MAAVSTLWLSPMFLNQWTYWRSQKNMLSNYHCINFHSPTLSHLSQLHPRKGVAPPTCFCILLQFFQSIQECNSTATRYITDPTPPPLLILSPSSLPTKPFLTPLSPQKLAGEGLSLTGERGSFLWAASGLHLVVPVSLMCFAINLLSFFILAIASSRSLPSILRWVRTKMEEVLGCLTQL